LNIGVNEHGIVGDYSSGKVEVKVSISFDAIIKAFS